MKLAEVHVIYGFWGFLENTPYRLLQKMNYSGCHKYVPFARFANMRKCNPKKVQKTARIGTLI
jgi:hypothetical protein